MRIVLQRSLNSKVEIAGKLIGQIEKGFVLLVAIMDDDTLEDVNYLAKKVANMRLFEDSEGKINISAKESEAEILSISQFTLYASTKKGNRPSFTRAGEPTFAKKMYEIFNNVLRQDYGFKVEAGEFGAEMKVTIENDGPVTLVLDSKDRDW